MTKRDFLIMTLGTVGLKWTASPVPKFEPGDTLTFTSDGYTTHYSPEWRVKDRHKTPGSMRPVK